MNANAFRLALASALCAALPVAAQYAYPAKGQSQQQQQKDEGECGAWATGQTGNDTGDAAKIGAVAGASAQRGANRRAARDQQAAAGQQQQAGQAAHQKARAACLEGRGYTVK